MRNILSWIYATFTLLFLIFLRIFRRTSSDCQLFSSECDNSSHEATPEHTLTEMTESTSLIQQQHPRLSQQNSLEKIVDGGGGGPQTIADLQQKLVQLTSQPSESLSMGTPPISHPATPHSHQTAGGYDTYMHNLQQKLANIGMPVGTGQSLVSIDLCYRSASMGLDD